MDISLDTLNNIKVFARRERIDQLERWLFNQMVSATDE